MDIDQAVRDAQGRVASGIDSNRASAIVANDEARRKLLGHLSAGCMSKNGEIATRSMVRFYEARICALAREMAP
jgi:hypothetical protein